MKHIANTLALTSIFLLTISIFGNSPIIFGFAMLTTVLTVTMFIIIASAKDKATN